MNTCYKIRIEAQEAKIIQRKKEIYDRLRWRFRCSLSGGFPYDLSGDFAVDTVINNCYNEINAIINQSLGIVPRRVVSHETKSIVTEVKKNVSGLILYQGE